MKNILKNSGLIICYGCSWIFAIIDLLTHQGGQIDMLITICWFISLLGMLFFACREVKKERINK